MAHLSKKITTEEVYEHIDSAIDSHETYNMIAALLLARLYITKLEKEKFNED